MKRVRNRYTIFPVANFISTFLVDNFKKKVMSLLKDDIEKSYTLIPPPFSKEKPRRGPFTDDLLLVVPIPSLGLDFTVELTDSLYSVKWDDLQDYLAVSNPEDLETLHALVSNMTLTLDPLLRFEYSNRTQLIIEYPWITKYWYATPVVSEGRGYQKTVAKETSDKLYELLQTVLFLKGEGRKYAYSSQWPGKFYPVKE